MTELHIYDLLFGTDIGKSKGMSLLLSCVHEQKYLKQIYLINIYAFRALSNERTCVNLS